MNAEKTHAFIIKGLDNKPEEVKQSILDEYEIEAIKVYKLNTTFRSIYMLVTSSAITRKYLDQTIKYLMGVRVLFEDRRKERRIIQCRRYQQWAHATTNCYREQCAGNHATNYCEQHTKGELQLKCAYCDQNHKANDINCPVYQHNRKSQSQTTNSP